MNIVQMNKEIRKIEPNLKRNTDEFIAYQVLLAAAIVGPRQQPIIKFLRTKNWQKVVGFVRIARKHKIFVGDKLDSEIYTNDWVGLALGVGLLNGMFKRSPAQ